MSEAKEAALGLPTPRRRKTDQVADIPPPVPSVTVMRVVTLLVERERAGVNKYGTTVDRNDLTAAEWLQHAIEEQLDNVLYLMRLKDKLVGQ